MLLMGSDFIDNNASFNTQMKRNGPNIYLWAYAASGTDENSPALIQHMGSGYNATALAASLMGFIGVPEGTQSVGAGSWAWYQIRGKVEDVQGAATSFTGSVGHGIYYGAATGLGATGSSYIGGSPSVGRVGVLLQYANESTTADIYLEGMWGTGL